MYWFLLMSLASIRDNCDGRRGLTLSNLCSWIVQCDSCDFISQNFRHLHFLSGYVRIYSEQDCPMSEQIKTRSSQRLCDFDLKSV